MTVQLLCANCGMELNTEQDRLNGVHPWHSGAEWFPQGNKAWCDFFHRGIVAPTPPGYSDDLFKEYGGFLLDSELLG